MPRSLTIKERAHRQRAMMTLRSWMEASGVSRQYVAEEMGITIGHLSTLINANRTPSQGQVDIARAMVNGTTRPPKVVSNYEHEKVQKPKARSAGSESKRAPKPNKLRPMNKFEAEFVVTIAKAWISANPGIDKGELVDVVRALSVGIRS